VASESLARTVWPGQDPLGKRLLLTSGQYLDISGVARDVPNPLSDSPVAYLPEDPNTGATNLLVRCVGDPRAAGRAIQAAVRAANPDFLVTARPLQTWIDDQEGVFLRIGSFVWTIGAVAWALAIVGIYGMVSFEVSRRTREIGIRAALGAKRLDILREVLVSAGKPVAAGLVAGLWLSLAAGAILKHEVLDAPAGIDAGSAVAYLGTTVLLALAAVAAISISARRGSHVDPMEALRHE
jgi:predicted lysophospholipase L1 biosynthesis ABC-type transport system permease subunit